MRARAGAEGRAPAGARRRRRGCWRICSTSAAQTRRRRRCARALGLLSHAVRHRPVRRGARQLEHGVSARARAGGARDLAKTYPGKAHEVGWRVGDAAVRDGVLYLDGLLRPADQAVAYVVDVRAQRSRSRRRRCGWARPGRSRSGSTARRCSSTTCVRPAALDQDAVGVRLGRGWNRILIKTVDHRRGLAPVRARSPTPAGPPLALRRRAGRRAAAAAARGAAGASRAGAAGRPTLDDAARAPARRAGAGRRAAAAWLDLARAARLAGAARPRRPRGRRRVRAGARAALGRPRWALRLAALPTSPTTRRPAAPRRSSERRAGACWRQPPGGSRRAWRALLLARLGERRGRSGATRARIERWREALAVDPGCWPAALALAEEESDAGLPLAALARLEALPPRGAGAAARAARGGAPLRRRGAAARGRSRARRSWRDERRRDVDLLHQLARPGARARRRRRGARAAGGGGGAAARPAVAGDRARRACSRARGTRSARWRRCEALAARLPDEPAALVALGKLLAPDWARRDEALAPLRAALALRPQDPELKRYLDRLAAGERGDVGLPDELARRFAEDARALLPPRGAGAPPTRPASGAVVLLDRRVVRVHRNGLSRTFAQRVVQVLTERGAEENKEFAVHYTPGQRGGRHPAGARLPARRARRRSRPGGDRSQRRGSVRALVRPLLRQPRRGGALRGAAPGRRRRDPVPGRRRRQREPVGRLLRRPAVRRRDDPEAALGLHADRARSSRPIYANVPRLPRLDRQVDRGGDDRVYRFAARDVAKIDAEPAMPGFGETSPYLHVSTYATWDDVGAWYWRLVEEQLTRRRRDPPDRARAGQARHDGRRPRARRLRLRRRRARATSGSSSASTATSPTRSRRCSRAGSATARTRRR